MSEYFQSLSNDSNNKQATVSTTQTDFLRDQTMITTVKTHQLIERNFLHEKEIIFT